MRTKFNRTLIATALGALTMGGTIAQAAALPAVQQSGAVQYLSGGIGQDESMAIEQASHHWPLTLEFAARDQHRADFLADVNVVVRDAGGHTLLRTVSTGPFVLAKLAPGQYDVDATLAGKTLREKVVVKHDQPARALFLWPTEAADQQS
ncbi:MAG TPA: carboxypeptidase regulatory-like domain-containing protein [Variovorax sp.]|jgi:hypothetical protein